MDKFSNNTIQNIKSYVYRLIDPRNGETFYVGKGTGNRVFEHAKGAVKSNNANEKISRIKEIIKDGLEVIHVIQRWGLTDEEAILVESAVIDCYPGLSNIQGGHDNKHGVTNAESLEMQFGLNAYEEPDFNYILIKITDRVYNKNIDKDDPIYETTRYAWVLNMENAKQCPYVISSLNGIVKGVFKVDKWYVVPERKNRIAFEGHRDEALEKIYVNKTKIPEYYKLRGNIQPVQYGKNNKYNKIK